MFFEQITTPGLGCFSYIIGCPKAGIAAVVDPRRDIDIYPKLAKKHGMRITHVFDTHVHADHISGTRELARATGAGIHIHESAPVGYEAVKIRHGDSFLFGAAAIRVLHTPGHTPNSVSLLVSDMALSPAEPRMILTGDLLFIGDTGRPDLPGEEILDEQIHNLYTSLHMVLGEFGDGLEVYPGHGQGSLCGSGMSAKPHSTLGFERLTNPRLRLKNFADFKTDILSHLPMRPQSFSHIIATNLRGAPLLPLCETEDRSLTPEALAQLAHQGALVLDLRETLSYAAAHIPGSINVDASAPPALNWVGTVVPPGSRLALVLNSDGEFSARVTELRRIGYDDIAGYLHGGIHAWIDSGKALQSMPFIAADALKARLAEPNPPRILDVRTEKEFQHSRIQGALHVPFDKLLADNSCPSGENVVVCQSGYRSSIAASLLQARGCRGLSVLAGGMAAYQ